MDYGTIFLILIILVIVIGLLMYYNDRRQRDPDSLNVHDISPDEQQRRLLEAEAATEGIRLAAETV
jgi:hypothetical protein